MNGARICTAVDSLRPPLLAGDQGGDSKECCRPLDCSGGMECANFGPLWYNQQDNNHSERDANMMTKVLFVCHGRIFQT